MSLEYCAGCWYLRNYNGMGWPIVAIAYNGGQMNDILMRIASRGF